MAHNNTQQQQQQLDVLRDLQELRQLKLARSRVVGILGGNRGGGQWRTEQYEQDRLTASLLKNEAQARQREAKAKLRVVRTTVAFRLDARGGGAVRAELPRPLARVRALRVVGGTVPHPLARTFRDGQDDCVPLGYTQRWEVTRLRLRLSGVVDGGDVAPPLFSADPTKARVHIVATQGGKVSFAVDAPEFNDANKAKPVATVAFSAAVDAGPEGLGDTLATYFTNAAAAGGEALRDVMTASLVRLPEARALLVCTAEDGVLSPPPHALFTMAVTGQFAAYWMAVGDAEAAMQTSASTFILIEATEASARSAAQARSRTVGSADAEAADHGLLTSDDDLMAWSGSYAPSHRASTALSRFVSALTERPLAFERVNATSTTTKGVLLERTATASLQFGQTTLARDEAAFVLEGAVNHYAQVLELGVAASSSTKYLHVGTYGERVSGVLDPPATATAHQVSFRFRSGVDSDRQAAAVFGFEPGKDVVFERGRDHVVVAPRPFMHHRSGQLVRVACEQVESRVGGADARAGWFEYGTYHEQAQTEPMITTNLPTGSYGDTAFSPELRLLRHLDLKFFTREHHPGSGAIERPISDPDSPGYVLVLEAEVAPL